MRLLFEGPLVRSEIQALCYQCLWETVTNFPTAACLRFSFLLGPVLFCVLI